MQRMAKCSWPDEAKKELTENDGLSSDLHRGQPGLPEPRVVQRATERVSTAEIMGWGFLTTLFSVTKSTS